MGTWEQVNINLHSIRTGWVMGTWEHGNMETLIFEIFAVKSSFIMMLKAASKVGTWEHMNYKLAHWQVTCLSNGNMRTLLLEIAYLLILFHYILKAASKVGTWEQVNINCTQDRLNNGNTGTLISEMFTANLISLYFRTCFKSGNMGKSEL